MVFESVPHKVVVVLNQIFLNVISAIFAFSEWG